MKRVIYAPGLLAIFAMTASCDEAAQRLRQWTDIDTTDTNAEVSIVRRDDLDQPGYLVIVPGSRVDLFERALENAGGRHCMELLVNRSGCGYTSSAGHNVFIERKDPLKYVIYTSG